MYQRLVSARYRPGSGVLWHVYMENYTPGDQGMTNSKTNPKPLDKLRPPWKPQNGFSYFVSALNHTGQALEVRKQLWMKSWGFTSKVIYVFESHKRCPKWASLRKLPYGRFQIYWNSLPIYNLLEILIVEENMPWPANSGLGVYLNENKSESCVWN